MKSEQLKQDIEKILLLSQKPARYTGGELNEVVKDIKDIDLHFAFCFPDIYEIGMSHLGMKILYSLLNEKSNIWCERVFSPWVDMRELMIKNDIPLYGLESFTPLYEFDIIGFTLQYELSYTGILDILKLGKVPLKSKDRKELKNLVIAGGPCTCNPEPLCDFIDIFVLGEGEEVTLELTKEYIKAKKNSVSKDDFLASVCNIKGVYVPSLYEVEYNEDLTVKSVTSKGNAPAKVQKSIIENMDKVFFPDKFIVPFIDIVHDRVVVEIMRGCIRGCRFCQAGYIYRPLREKKADTLDISAKELCKNTGYEEISLASLSTSDYTELEELLDKMTLWTDDQRINLSLPSLRIDNFSKELAQKIKTVRKSGLTFAPEAGSQRLRNIINKNISEEEILNTCRTAFENGYTSVKLYFMIGLPFETMDDIKEIAVLAHKVLECYAYHGKKGKAASISVSVSSFVPKAFTPFQFEPQDTREQLKDKQHYLIDNVKSRKIKVSYHESKTSFLEAVFARGDRRLAKVILKAYESGCILDGWGECFSYEKWINAFDECEVDMGFYANRKREYDEVLPWDHLDYLVDKSFLIKQNELAKEEKTSPDCKTKCLGCGVSKHIGGESNAVCKNSI